MWITDGLQDGELRRWEIHHPAERVFGEGNAAKDATFVRICQCDPFPGSTYLTLFAESDEPGTPRLRMNLFPDMIDPLIEALQAFKAHAEGTE